VAIPVRCAGLFSFIRGAVCSDPASYSARSGDAVDACAHFFAVQNHEVTRNDLWRDPCCSPDVHVSIRSGYRANTSGQCTVRLDGGRWWLVDINLRHTVPAPAAISPQRTPRIGQAEADAAGREPPITFEEWEERYDALLDSIHGPDRERR